MPATDHDADDELDVFRTLPVTSSGGAGISVIALWLGHEGIETAQIYLHADLAIKERALARTTPPNTKPGRYRPPDTLLAFLEGL